MRKYYKLDIIEISEKEQIGESLPNFFAAVLDPQNPFRPLKEQLDIFRYDS